MNKQLNIIKRDGSVVKFDKTKIENAILKAMKYGSGIYEEEMAKEIANEIELSFNQTKDVATVNKVEDMVYKNLINHKHELTAKAYEGYRAVQSFKREVNTTDDSILGLLDNSNEDVMNENSNKNGLLASTQRDLIAGEVSKDIARRKLIPAHIAHAHDEGVLHYHDMDYAIQPIHNCMLINLEDMLNNGTVISNKLVESPKSFTTACTVTTQIIAQIASGQYGGNSITIKHIAPFLRVSYDKYLNKYKDKYPEEMAKDLAEDRMLEELKNGIQTIRYQLSTLYTSNGQSPFSTIYLEIEEGNEYEREMALICEEMIAQRLEGMKNYKGQEVGEEFPKLVYLLDEHNCLEGGKYDYITKLAAKCNTKRLVPDYQSAKIMKKNYEGNTFPPMGCRSHLSPWKDENGNYKWYGRFNQGVISLNLVQVALTANQDMEKFWEILDERLELCREALMVRHDLLKGVISDVSPIHWQHGGIARLKKGEKIDSLLENGYSTLSLGYVGVYEMTQAMLGISHTTKDGEKFALEVMNHLNNTCQKWKDETGLGFGLYGTPGESLTSRFCRIDKQKFGEIKNVTDRMYYTNSYHVHVSEEIDAFEKLKFESQFHDISLGGCISYIEVPDMSKNLPAVEQIINYIYHNIQYAEINTKPDICYSCGYTGEIKLDKDLEWYCPNCGNRDKNEMQVMRRTCGYIGANMWGKGRTQEIGERVLHL
ncbi:anaerobic ribonucleoside-triphosphate reductase [Paraclostridium bifermentans]|uniref:Anaerobic ribonucleoside-triphosphate reductase n=1 Tax=Paraclostridium bifermentans ATCC 638 = DSM 14991 TaxID=1233171 RepID=T4VK91_PARBF|nr:anaerobic ribonucleoside-triphosphate reductase [Paraclostridium bifermentans]EQK41176.1 anaerobic ribonucleoside-triphosphate reductase [[Clostridium] bifermentans ATCC 638] [Paraclostridium bifermentans ATCC 638 = DSM 14991]MBS6509989.1 anaerobic ribonucleoside-triphosphate reductase [Paraclostridium bifermentans]MDU3804453.1 anaerobic ribonucleoside-triphosphate reductase [Paraclostridium bifermentans]RIZ57324.1 anaerobic ribonucleoside-triphosphate reductase [Paraclostridium bifermentans